MVLNSREYIIFVFIISTSLCSSPSPLFFLCRKVTALYHHHHHISMYTIFLFKFIFNFYRNHYSHTHVDSIKRLVSRIYKGVNRESLRGKIGNTGPVRFERGAAAFNEASRVIRLYESGESEHYSPDNNSADLINSFIERECQNQFRGTGGDQNYKDHQDDLEDSPNCSYLETKERLENLLSIIDDVREKICKEIWFLGERSSQSFIKHRLMSHLHDRDFDVVYVGKLEDVKQTVRLMCNVMRESMGMDKPPWRRYGYMQAKWVGHYKWTTNEVLSNRSALVYRLSFSFFGPSPFPNPRPGALSPG